MPASLIHHLTRTKNVNFMKHESSDGYVHLLAHFVRLWRLSSRWWSLHRRHIHNNASAEFIRTTQLWDEINFAANFRFIWCLVTLMLGCVAYAILVIWLRGFQSTKAFTLQSILFLCVTTKGMGQHFLRVWRCFRRMRSRWLQMGFSKMCWHTVRFG